MVEAVIGSLVGKLKELAMSEARAMVAVNDDIRSLRDKLMSMQAFLRDAEPRRRHQNDELISKKSPKQTLYKVAGAKFLISKKVQSRHYTKVN